MRRHLIVWISALALFTTSAVGESVSNSGDRRIDFDTEIMPLLTRHGCNAGSCHGAAIGRGGFKLSLLGSAASADHDTIVHALEGRRVNRFDVDRSLVLLKPSEQIGHEGGLVLPDDSKGYEVLRTWIAQGALREPTKDLSSLAILPSDVVIQKPGDSVPYSITATFTERVTGRTIDDDVADWAVLTPGDEDAVTIDASTRKLTAHRPGVHVVIVRFMDRVLPIRLTVPMQAEGYQPERTRVKKKKSIDRYVDEQLDRLRIPRSPATDDYAFLRRITLDLCGRLPTVEESKKFAADDSSDKRETRISELLNSQEFADCWALKWANILKIDSKELQVQGADAYHRWLADRIREDRPLSETVAELVTANGDSYQVGAANFSRFGKSPGDLAEQASRVFMGIRLRCANCHNHPLDHWTQDDYHGLSAIFAKVNRGQIVSVSDRGEVTHPVTGQPAVSRIPGLRFLNDGEDGRAELAKWLTSKDNRYLARNIVNRIWRELMGRGLVEPVDDLRATNPATHPELIGWLASDLVAGDFRMKRTIALICNSEAYQRQSRSVAGNESDTEFYSHALERPLDAQIVADAISDTTGVPFEVADDGTAVRMVSFTDNRAESRTLDLLGRCDRSIGCTSSGASAMSLSRALHLINGPLLKSRIASDTGTLSQLLFEHQDDEVLLDQLFMLTLSRPNASKSDLWRHELANAALDDDDDRRKFFEDIFWGILASKAFATNH